jgi:hypothetical protein
VIALVIMIVIVVVVIAVIVKAIFMISMSRNTSMSSNIVVNSGGGGSGRPEAVSSADKGLGRSPQCAGQHLRPAGALGGGLLSNKSMTYRFLAACLLISQKPSIRGFVKENT